MKDEDAGQGRGRGRGRGRGKGRGKGRGSADKAESSEKKGKKSSDPTELDTAEVKITKRPRNGRNADEPKDQKTSKKVSKTQPSDADHWENWWDGEWVGEWGEDWDDRSWGHTGKAWDAYAWSDGKCSLKQIAQTEEKEDVVEAPAVKPRKRKVGDSTKGGTGKGENGTEQVEKKKKKTEKDMEPPEKNQHPRQKSDDKQQPKRVKKQVREVPNPDPVPTKKTALKDALVTFGENYLGFQGEDFKAHVKAKLYAHKKDCSFNIYWTRSSVGVRSKAMGRDIAYFSFPCGQDVQWEVRMSVTLKAAELFVT